VRKAGSTTIVTSEDEMEWLENMPSGLKEPAHLSESRARRMAAKAENEQDEPTAKTEGISDEFDN
jgi:hypothetical protein